MSTDPRNADSSHRFQSLDEPAATPATAPEKSAPVVQRDTRIKGKYHAMSEEGRREALAQEAARQALAREFAKSGPRITDVDYSTATQAPMVATAPDMSELQPASLRYGRRTGVPQPAPGGGPWSEVYRVTQDRSASPAAEISERARQIAARVEQKQARAGRSGDAPSQGAKQESPEKPGRENTERRLQRTMRVQTNELSERAQRIASRVQEKHANGSYGPNGNDKANGNDGAGR